MHSSRRQFIKAASGAIAATYTAASYARIVGANDRITVGQIGCGGRGYNAHMGGVRPYAKTENFEYVAICDVWNARRDRAVARVKEWFNRDAKAVAAPQKLLDMKDVDAVMIATCDHQHTTHLKWAVEAGKDVYCEKPLAMDMASLRACVDAVKKTDRVVQIGTQLRSYPSFAGCRELFRTGVLGKVARVEQMRNGTRPYWYERLTDKVTASDVNWPEFLCGKPDRPFTANLFTGWWGYRGFSDGPVPQLGVHFLDTMHYIMDCGIPQSCVCHGGQFTFKDEKYRFDCPDSIQATWVYPEGFVVSYSTNFGNATGNGSRMYGQHGTLDWTDWNHPFLTSSAAPSKAKPAEPTPVKPIERPDHFQNWLQCLRTRQTPNAPIDAGYQHSVASIMAMRAFDTGRRQIYDPQTRDVREG
jgi:predicted dehydrogenase